MRRDINQTGYSEPSSVGSVNAGYQPGRQLTPKLTEAQRPKQCQRLVTPRSERFIQKWATHHKPALV